MSFRNTRKFTTTDPKHTLAYYSLYYGVISDDLEVVKKAIKSGAQVSLVNLAPTSDYEEGYDEKPCSLIDYAITNSKPAIFDFLISNHSDHKKMMMKILFKAFIESKDDSEISDIIKKYVTTKNINQVVQIKNYTDLESDRKSFSTSLLHIACANLQVKAVELLLELGANPNSNLNPENRTPASLVLDHTYKTEQEKALTILTLLHKAGADFSLKTNEEGSVWRKIIKTMNVPRVKQLFKLGLPNNLSEIIALKSKSSSLFPYWKKLGGSLVKYPLLHDIETYEKKPVHIQGLTDSYYRVEGFFKDVQELEGFVKNKSLKKALQKKFGISSSQFTKAFAAQFFIRYDKLVAVNAEILKTTQTLSKVFLKDKDNYSDLITVMQSASTHKAVDGLKKEYLNRVIKFLDANFTPAQQKDLFLNTTNQAEIEDIVDMYERFSKNLSTRLNSLNFVKINNFTKLHDFLSAEVKKLDQTDYPLNQDTHTPQLKELENIVLPQGFKFKVAQSNHELIEWGTLMGHCIGGGSYAERASRGECVLLALVKDHEPKFAIEISDKTFEQVQGKSHTKPTKQVMEVVVKQLKTAKVLHAKQPVKGWYDEMVIEESQAT